MEKDLRLADFKPRTALTTKVTHIPHPKFPVIDVHNHLGSLIPGLSFSGEWAKRPVTELIAVMDEAGVETIVDLDGQSGDTLKREIARYQEPYPGRFAVFHGLDYSIFQREKDFGRALARSLRESVTAGAKGLKVWKPLGLTVRDSAEKLVAVDDPRLDELWSTAGELGVPVLIHVGDPVAFFQPLDHFNERCEELHGHPDWHFPSPAFPAIEAIMNQFANIVIRHPKTNFIGAHVGCYAENLEWVSSLMQRAGNLYVDISARLGELGRQPYSSRDFFLRHADRVLFGTDMNPRIEMYQLHYRFLETQDEYFNYSLNEVPPQGRWQICGVHLPDDVLKKIYADNARGLLRL